MIKEPIEKEIPKPKFLVGEVVMHLDPIFDYEKKGMHEQDLRYAQSKIIEATYTFRYNEIRKDFAVLGWEYITERGKNEGVSHDEEELIKIQK